MSRCVICDVFIENPKLNPIDHKSEPCLVCQRMIQETLEAYNDPEDDCYAYIEDDSRYDDRKYLINSIEFDGHDNLPIGEKFDE